jgi:hypothetical protein
MKTIVYGSCLFVLLGLVMACESEKKKSKQEELTIVVQADRSKIAKEEQELQSRLNEFSQERERLRKEKESLMASKEQLHGHDQTQARRLSEKERNLYLKEKEMWDREKTLESERMKLARQKDELLGKISSDAPLAASNTSQREVGIARREKSVAVREADVARREKEIGRREAGLAAREAAFLKLKSSIASYRAPAAPAGGRRGHAVSRKRAQTAYKGALAKMRKRGILPGDLPLENSGLIKEIAGVSKEGDYDRMMDLSMQLEAIVQNISVDAEFIDRKFQRLAQLNSEKKPSGKDKQTVSNLLRKATQLYSDGKLVLANREMNKIFALLAR